MKRLIAITATAMLTTGCASMFFTSENVAQSVHLGMSVDEFKKLAKPMINSSVELDSMTPEGTVYRIEEWRGESPHRYLARTRLYFFNTAGQLTEVATRDFGRPFNPLH
jgi:hypothetical protein